MLRALFRDFRTLQLPAWVIMYPEGSRFSRAKHAEARAFCAARGLAPLQHLLVPRTKGFVETVQQLRDTHIHHVYDLTLMYTREDEGVTHRVPTLFGAHAARLSPPYGFHVHVRRYAMHDLPAGAEALATWLHQRFRDKDAFVEQARARKAQGKALVPEAWTLPLPGVRDAVFGP